MMLFEQLIELGNAQMKIIGYHIYTFLHSFTRWDIVTVPWRVIVENNILVKVMDFNN